ncbi:MAG: hypothetical protein LBI49_04525, partial [Nocardiopsaceae bacterium]|nr:hypothetical protein [Nocardiopsaceae bacterium]
AVGANWHSIVDAFQGPTYIIAAIALLAVVIAVWRYLRAHRSAPPAAAGERPVPGNPRAQGTGRPPGSGAHRK